MACCKPDGPDSPDVPDKPDTPDNPTDTLNTDTLVIDSTAVSIFYTDTGIVITNPLENEILVQQSNGHISVRSQAAGMKFVLSGAHPDASFSIASDSSFSLILDSLNLTSLVGPAIYVQSRERTLVYLNDSTENFLNDAITYSSGYATNLATISTLVGRNDWVLSDKWNHASIVDGCLLSRAEFVRFRHNDMNDLARQLRKAPAGVSKLVVADAVFSMDGDIVDLPALVEVCRRYGARLMIDEAHSLGVLGKTGRGIEEHFDMPGVIDIKMGTLSKTIPAIGGYIAGSQELITYLKHVARAFVFSAALPPPVAAAAKAAFEVLEDEAVERKTILQRNVEHFLGGLKALGFNTGRTVTPIIPVIVGTDERAMAMTHLLQEDGIFALSVLPPAVPEGTSRIRANVTAAHTVEDIDDALAAFARAGRSLGIIA